jgi:hypothetical protein
MGPVSPPPAGAVATACAAGRAALRVGATLALVRMGADGSEYDCGCGAACGGA